MGLIYEHWTDNRGLESEDLADGFRFPLDNLARFAKAFLQPVTGIYRGGRVRQTPSPSKNVVVEPLGGVTDAGLLLVLETEVVLAVPDNATANPRIDRVSINASAVDGPSLPRPHWNPGTESAFTQNVVVTRTLEAVPVLTVGTPASSPVAPPLPAGHISLATVNVAAGFGSIANANIDRTSSPDPLQAITWGPDFDIYSLPFALEDRRLRVSTRAGGVSLVFAQVTVGSIAGLFDKTKIHVPLIIRIEEVGGATIAQSYQRLLFGAAETFVLAGLVVGPKFPAVDYQLRFLADGLGGGGQEALAQISFPHPHHVFGAISL